MLFLVPTPIGNLQDITFRAIQTLKDVDLILAEDTRTSKKLLNHFEISTPMQSFHAHNEHKKLDYYLEQLKEGKDLALISDAGSPCISDPGFLLSRACVEAGVKISALPGATAFVPALSVSGLPSDKFYFEGFLPHKKGRQTRLKYITQLSETVILYESPYRIVKCLEQLIEHCGTDRKVSVSREISKLHEEVLNGRLEDVRAELASRSKVKGEIVLVLEGTVLVK